MPIWRKRIFRQSRAVNDGLDVVVGDALPNESTRERAVAQRGSRDIRGPSDKV